ncbi:hypothetical protein L7F22_005048 [Adiantum nelumboides]|nr:hypothetical protein [Adiantum nelumboides]
MANTRSNCIAAALLLLALCVAHLQLAAVGDKFRNSVVSYYLQQEYGPTELLMVAAARPAVNGTATGFGLEVMHEFVMTSTADPTSDVMGYVRGTPTRQNRLLSATLGVRRSGRHGRLPDVQGYNVGTFVSSSPMPSGSRHVVTYYEAHLCSIGDN